MSDNSVPPSSPPPALPSTPRLAELRRRQRQSANLTTFIGSGDDGELTELPYPVLSNGVLVDANKIWLHVETHDLGPFHCFHGLPARSFIPPSGRYEGEPIIACAFRQPSLSCGYWIMLRQVHDDPSALLVAEYPLRGGQLLAHSVSPTRTPAASGYEGDISAPATPVRASVSLDPFVGNQLIALDPTIWQEGLDRGLDEERPSSRRINVVSPPGRMAAIWASHPWSMLPFSQPPLPSQAPTMSQSHGPKKSRSSLSKIKKRSFAQTRIKKHHAPPSSPTPAGSSTAAGPSLATTIPLPNPTSQSHDAAAALADHHTTHLVPYTSPTETNHFRNLMHITDERGVSSNDFWGMWRFCRGCDHIINGEEYNNHVCDLSLED